MKTKTVRSARMREISDSVRFTMKPHARNSPNMRKEMRYWLGHSRPPKETDKNLQIMRAAARRTGLAQLLIDLYWMDSIMNYQETEADQSDTTFGVVELLERAMRLLGITEAERRAEVFPYLPVPRIACKPHVRGR